MFIVLETSFAVEMFTSFFPPFYQSNSRKLSQRDRCLSEYNEEKKKSVTKRRHSPTLILSSLCFSSIAPTPYTDTRL